MIKWYHKGWYLEITLWSISFWTPRKQYLCNWWNPFTKKVLIYISRYCEMEHTIDKFYLYPYKYNKS